MSEHDSRSDGWQLARRGPEAYETYLVPDMFRPWADELLDAGGVRRGDRVLDVGTGTGIVARQSAPRVGVDGRVVGVDVNAGMLAVASATAGGDHPIEWGRADATALPFDAASFDAVLCQQVLQFVSAPRRALREMRRVLASGGRLAASVWRPLEFNPGYEILADALGTHVGDRAAAMMRSPFSAWSGSDMRTLVGDAGFRDVRLTVESGTMRYPSVEEFVRREAASSPLSGPLGSLDPAVRGALLDDLEETLTPSADDGAVDLPMETYVVVARR